MGPCGTGKRYAKVILIWIIEPYRKCSIVPSSIQACASPTDPSLHSAPWNFKLGGICALEKKGRGQKKSSSFASAEGMLYLTASLPPTLFCFYGNKSEKLEKFWETDAENTPHSLSQGPSHTSCRACELTHSHACKCSTYSPQKYTHTHTHTYTHTPFCCAKKTRMWDWESFII
jgi:hypothetical protein